MVIDDLNIVGIPVMPSEADTPLLIYANAVLPLARAKQCLKMIARGNPQRLDVGDGFQHIKFPQGDTLKALEFPASAGYFQLFSLATSITFDHEPSPFETVFLLYNVSR